MISSASYKEPLFGSLHFLPCSEGVYWFLVTITKMYNHKFLKTKPVPQWQFCSQLKNWNACLGQQGQTEHQFCSQLEQLNASLVQTEQLDTGQFCLNGTNKCQGFQMTWKHEYEGSSQAFHNRLNCHVAFFLFNYKIVFWKQTFICMKQKEPKTVGNSKCNNNLKNLKNIIKTERKEAKNKLTKKKKKKKGKLTKMNMTKRFFSGISFIWSQWWLMTGLLFKTFQQRNPINVL